MNSNKRIAVNTIILYVNFIITIIVNLYSTRLILNAMGVEDYGIINLISGIVAMLSFVQNSMSISSQRYMSVNMGKHDQNIMIQVFNSSLALHLILALILLIVLEGLTPLIFDSSIQIPENRVISARILYQLTIIGTTLVVITVPYDAALNAHENMLVYSIASITESVIRLIGAFILLVYSKDKLIFYGGLLITIRLISMIIKSSYCRNHYKETLISIKSSDKVLMKDMFSFAFWNMFGALAMTTRSQGVAIVMNTFFGVIINAAFGIAIQISGQLQNFTATISKAMSPQIMQRAGSGDKNGMISLSLKQCKYASFLLAYAIIPLLFSMPFILKVWLKDVPEYSIVFCSLVLIVSLVQQSTNGIMSLIQATGVVRNYQFAVSLIMILNIPLAYVLLRIGVSAPFVIVGMIAIEVIAAFVRVLFAKILTSLSIHMFVKKVTLPIIIVYAIPCIVLISVKNGFFYRLSNIYSFLVLSSLAIVLISTTIYLVLSKTERTFILNIIRVKLKIDNRNDKNSNA